MQTRVQKKCPECLKKVTVLWHQIQGIRLLENVDGHECYKAKCPECSHVWHIRK